LLVHTPFIAYDAVVRKYIWQGAETLSSPGTRSVVERSHDSAESLVCKRTFEPQMAAAYHVGSSVHTPALVRQRLIHSLQIGHTCRNFNADGNCSAMTGFNLRETFMAQGQAQSFLGYAVGSILGVSLILNALALILH
jgi:hypothetical protein